MDNFGRRIGKNLALGIFGLVLMIGGSSPTWAQEMQKGGAEATQTAEAAKPTDAQLELNDRAVENIIEGNYARAVAQLEEAVLRGEFNILYLNLGRAYQKLGNCGKARSALAKAKTAPAVIEPAPHLVVKKAEQYLVEIESTCSSEDKTEEESAAKEGAANESGANENAANENAANGNAANGNAANENAASPANTRLDVRGQRPNLLYLELAGHGGAITLNYERFVLIDSTLLGVEYDLGVGVGFGHSEGELNFLGDKGTGRLTSIPVYATTTFFGGHHSLLFQLGVVAASFEILERGQVTDSAGTIAGFMQAGYQYQSNIGFLLRATLTTAKFSKRVVLPGISLGWSF